MFKPNRLAWKETASGKPKKNTLTNLGIISEMAKATNWPRILGRTANKIADGVNRVGTGTVDAASRSALDVLQHVSLTFRGIIANMLAPIIALDSDKKFGEKLTDSLKEIPLSVIGRNIGNIGCGVAGVASSLTGIGYDMKNEGKKLPLERFRIKRGIGLAGIAWKLTGGVGDILGSPYGADIVGANEEAEKDNEELRKDWRLGMITPFYRGQSHDSKEKKTQAKPKKEEKK